MSEEKIKACPFCGIGKGFVRPSLGEVWDAKCDCCNCALEGYPTENQALAAWNYRAGDHEPAMSKTPDVSTLASAQCSADPTDDVAYQSFVDEMSKICKCSHDQPCDGLLAGGMCDNLQWSNDDYKMEDEDE